MNNKFGQTELLENWKIVHKDQYGLIKDEDYIGNLIVDEGLDYTLGAALKGNSTGVWFIGLTDGSPTVDPADTIGNHPGWSEVTGYDENVRQTWQSGSVSNQVISNSSNPAIFNFNTDGLTVGGAFLISDDTKGGTQGVLYAVGPFEKGDKQFDQGDVIEITAEFSNSYDAT